MMQIDLTQDERCRLVEMIDSWCDTCKLFDKKKGVAPDCKDCVFGSVIEKVRRCEELEFVGRLKS
jgi:hypothetical protein